MPDPRAPGGQTQTMETPFYGMPGSGWIWGNITPARVASGVSAGAPIGPFAYSWGGPAVGGASGAPPAPSGTAGAGGYIEGRGLVRPSLPAPRPTSPFPARGPGGGWWSGMGPARARGPAGRALARTEPSMARPSGRAAAAGLERLLSPDDPSRTALVLVGRPGALLQNGVHAARLSREGAGRKLSPNDPRSTTSVNGGFEGRPGPLPGFAAPRRVTLENAPELGGVLFPPTSPIVAGGPFFPAVPAIRPKPAAPSGPAKTLTVTGSGTPSPAPTVTVAPSIPTPTGTIPTSWPTAPAPPTTTQAPTATTQPTGPASPVPA